MSVIGYSYDADWHCESCMLDYARSVEFSEYDFSKIESLDEIESNIQGFFDLMKAVELEVIRDSEGNAIHPIFSIDEWYNIGEGNQTLGCSDCGKVLDTYDSEE